MKEEMKEEMKMKNNERKKRSGVIRK